jgi:FG-GAP repeat protein
VFAALAILGVASSAHAAELLYTVDNPTPANDGFGIAVAVSGNYLVVGAPADDTLATNAGAAYLFDAATGNLLPTFNNPKPINPSAFADDNFGGSVAVSGNYVVVGASGEDIGPAIQQSAVGMAYVFDATTGVPLQTLNNPTPLFGEGFGSSVAVSGTKAVIGTPWPNTNGASAIGSAYLFDVTTSALLRSFGSPTPVANDRFGGAVAIDGNYVIIGEPTNGAAGSGPGAVYVFDATTGNLLRTIANPGVLDPTARDRFGASLAISGTRLLVGAPNVDRTDVGNSVRVGAAYLFDFTTGDLLHAWNNPDPRDEGGSASSGESFGGSVALNGSKVLIGTAGDDNGRGAAYLFDAATGALLDTYYDPTPLGFEGFASAVAVTDSTVWAGVPTGTGFVRVFEAAAPVLLGDYNDNGTVGPEDYDTWRANFGSSNLAADGNGNRIVDAADYVVWRNNFGVTSNAAESPIQNPTVPEPLSMANVIAGLISMMLVRCRTKRFAAG